MTPHPAELGVEALQRDLTETFLRYYDTAYGLRDAGVMQERRALLTDQSALFQEPFLELLPDYVLADTDLAGSCTRAGVPDLAGLAQAGLLAGRDRLFAHQDSALQAALGGRHTVVTSGTGSGKTEAFLLPVLARLVRESAAWGAPAADSAPWWSGAGPWQPQRPSGAGRPAAVRALVLYPMNALVEDQLVRLRRALDGPEARRWLQQARQGNRFYFGRYTGRTPVSAVRNSSSTSELRAVLRKLDERGTRLRRRLADDLRAGRQVRPDDAYFLARLDGAEMRSRWDMQQAPPDILITNYSMLNVVLMRDREHDMLAATRAWLDASPKHVFTLVVDELHSYRGTPGTEVAYLLRKLLDRLGLHDRPGQLSVLAASASLEAGRDRDMAFLEQFFGQPRARFAVVPGALARPAGPGSVAAAAPLLAQAKAALAGGQAPTGVARRIGAHSALFDSGRESDGRRVCWRTCWPAWTPTPTTPACASTCSSATSTGCGPARTRPARCSPPVPTRSQARAGDRQGPPSARSAGCTPSRATGATAGPGCWSCCTARPAASCSWAATAPPRATSTPSTWCPASPTSRRCPSGRRWPAPPPATPCSGRPPTPPGSRCAASGAAARTR